MAAMVGIEFVLGLCPTAGDRLKQIRENSQILLSRVEARLKAR
ncbi:hypothetical protein [Scytonema sp. PCC 10023]